MRQRQWCLLELVCLISTIHFVSAFVSRCPTKAKRSNSLDPSFNAAPVNEAPSTSTPPERAIRTPQMREGLLISSFSDGLLPNKMARDVVGRGLWRCLLTEEQQIAETALANSVRFSPCNGPNTESLLRLEECDTLLQRFHDLDENWRDVLQERATLRRERCDTRDTVLRFVYIPTAMYALRPGSNNTPGKQRQRARADAKQRRDELATLLLDAMNVDDQNPVSIAAITLDLDDGSVKHPMVSTLPNQSASAAFPNGKDALQNWKPHFVYVQGGNTFWLHHCLEKGNWGESLLQLLRGDTTFYCGASAGAILAGASMETASWKGWDDPSVVPDRGTYEAWTGVAGLDLLGHIAIFPHYEEQWSELVLEKSEELKARTGIGIVSLRDEEVCYVCDGELTLL